MNRLEEIIAHKQREIEQLRARADELHRTALLRNDFRSLRSALQREDAGLSVIAEVKQASPSAGLIAESFDPVAIAQTYERDGAHAVSVLTDSKFFRGALDHLVAVRAASLLPVLRKDFVLDEVQIAEAAAGGADAILLIVAALSQTQLTGLAAAAAKYQLDVLVEVHTRDELDRAIDAGAEMIGINNRDLGTFTVDLGVTERLSEEVPKETVLVSESGIKTKADVQRLKACGVDAVLVGEALMRGNLTVADLLLA